ncbi:MAG TPA: UDP-N-acetylmuramoyl-L-alanyl-D-glutamate--2,6-diaminopimelate ligase, partial [bacterium]|nr:UDP-N-acetylmuramoyl-L-alanyl-D-glutamate--2,6-diaminopimelate ligase [bacterium]
SHSISQNRFDLSEVDFAIYTNLTQDHLDYHQTMENYAEAKAGLFRQMNNCGVAIINTDDNYSVKMLEASVNKKILTYGLNEKADIRFSNIDCTISKTNFEIIAKNKKLKVSSNLIGLHNVYNIVAAYCVSHLLKISDAQFLKGIKNSKKIDGRLDKVSNRLKLNIFVDYAHTPDALHNVLNALNNLKKDGTRLITVFGCGGNRDKLKRPLMGRIVVEKSDVAIITSDNPRKEEPRAIIDDILKGCAGAENYIVEVDRRKGISKALEIARAGDIILIAGKGHETYQIIGDKILNFDDRKVVKELLKKF